MVSLGILVSGVAHEINNPNGLIALNIGLLTEAWSKAVPVLDRYLAEYGDFSFGVMNYSEFREQLPLVLADTAASSERIRAIVDDLKGFSRPSDERIGENVSLNAVAASAVNMIATHLKKATRNFTLELDEDLPPIRGSARRLEQVLINLLLNACAALESSEQAIRMVVRAGANGEAIIEIQDQGRGIAPEDLPRVTDPFFTTRRSSGGTGLGLFVSAGIIEEHGGVLEFESTAGEGTTVRITFSHEPRNPT
jgi:polar amino acid transport system substrate-binding protein